jgi:hypothetical protein
MPEGDFSVRIWLKKGAYVFVEGGIGAVVSWLSGLPQTETVFAAIVILQLAANWWKHK